MALPKTKNGVIDKRSKGYRAAKIRAKIRGAQATQIGGDHYVSEEIQPWDAMQSWMSPEGFREFLRGNAIKYMARATDLTLSGKGGVEDVKKARHYLDKLLEVVGE